MNEEQAFDVVSALNRKHSGLEGIEMEFYSDSAVRINSGFLTTVDMEILSEIFPRIHFSNGLVIGEWS